MKSNYRKQQEAKKLLGVYILLALFGISFWFFAGKVQQNCIEGNNITLCD
jgi:hypothetical protein